MVRDFVILSAIIVLGAYLVANNMEASKTCAKSTTAADDGEGLSAVVIGATGATGIQVLRGLLTSRKWKNVVSVGRRKVPEDMLPSTDSSTSRLKEIVVSDMLDQTSMNAAMKDAGDYDAVFVCHGTTRGAAGGAEGFKKVEVGLTKTIANALVSAPGHSNTHVSVVSAQGANADISFAPDWIHPLLYVKTLGQKERVFLDRLDDDANAFKSVSIFRPGMLNRLKGDRWHENVINRLGMGLRVDTLANAMIRDAVARVAGKDKGARTYEGNAYIGGMC